MGLIVISALSASVRLRSNDGKVPRLREQENLLLSLLSRGAESAT